MTTCCNRMHLCDSCCYVYPDCGADYIEFGNGKGNDNVIDCEYFNIGDNQHIHCPDNCTDCN